MENRKNILITGASGLLGRALVNVFRSTSDWNVIGLANTRAGENLLKINLVDKEALTKVIVDNKVEETFTHIFKMVFNK